jgi:alkylation response protein AidB-like acyl-CoA dehydrogenase
MPVAQELASPLEAVARIAPIVREHADASEQQCTLARPTVDAILGAGLFRQLTPASLGGGELDPVTWFKVVEAMARVDGSAGWCLFINGGTGIIGAGMPEAAASALLSDPQTVIAGAVFPFGKATATEGGYRVNGQWPYASGCKHSTWLFGACVVFDGDSPRQSPRGPEIRLACAPESCVSIIDTWDVSGLAGTGSHDIAMADLFVEDAHCIPLGTGEKNRHYDGPLYRLPFFTLFAWPMAAVALGIAQHAIDAALDLAASKVPAGGPPGGPPLRERALFHLQLGEAVSAVRAARAWLHQSVGDVWKMAQVGAEIGLPARVDLAAAASNATQSSRRAVELMYLAGGGTSNYRSSPLQRCLRDIHALSQHRATSPATVETGGAMLAGLPPSNPLILL